MKNTQQKPIQEAIAVDLSKKLSNALLRNLCEHTGKLIDQTLDNAADPRAALEMIRTSAKALRREVDTLSGIAQIRAGEFEIETKAFRVTGLAEEVCGGLLGMFAEYGVELLFERPREEVVVCNDPLHIASALSGLLSASCRYRAGRAGTIHLTYHYSDVGQLVFIIKYNSPRDSQEHLTTTFNRFIEQGIAPHGQDDVQQLLLSRMIATAMGGALTIGSGDGFSTVIDLSFPCARLEGEAVDEQSGQASEADCACKRVRKPGPKRILVAEDVDSNYQLLQALIGRFYELTRARTGLEALTIFREGALQPDLILMDMKMPEMNGTEATREIRKISETVPIIALTANAFNDDKLEALNSGCNDFLTKPVSSVVLKETIEKYTTDVEK